MPLSKDLYASCACLNADWYESNLDHVIFRVSFGKGSFGEGGREGKGGHFSPPPPLRISAVN